MVKNTPPLGWNSWNTFAENIDEKLIRETADAMVSSGLKDAGYEYIIIDDCWSEHTRGSDGRLRPDKKKFPSGMKQLTDYVHSLGLKIGIYSCSGPLTCAGYPGSLGHEYADAATFAEWGFDYLKYDYCYHPDHISPKYLYRTMGTALASSGRDILFAACTWGADGTPEWIDGTGAHTWRSTGDIFDTYNSLRDLIKAQLNILPYGGVGCFNDMDMLITGMRGKGHVGIDGLSDEEYKLHMSVWSILASPLIIGCDIRNMDSVTKELLTNREMLAINQDPRGNRAYVVNEGDVSRGASPVFARILEGGDLAVCFTNLGDNDARVSILTSQLGLDFHYNKKVIFRDVWSNEKIAVDNECLGLELKSHTCRYFRVSIK